jgi:hypothetical protein
MSDALNWIGSVCSILGAVYACYQASISKSAAEISMSIKNQLINHRKTSELSELQTLLRAAQNAFNKYASSNPSSLKGIDHNSDAQVVLEFINKLKASRDYFADHFDNAADKTYDEINSNLALFRATIASSEVSTIGAEILTSITGFSPSLQRELNAHKEKTA